MSEAPIVVDNSLAGWIDKAYKLGVVAVIAMGLVWFLTQDVKTGLVEIRVAHASMTTQMQEVGSVNKDLLNKLDRIQRILTAMCVNAAGNDSVARASCVQ